MKWVSALVLSALACVRCAWACSCSWAPVPEAFRNASVVVLGTVSSVDDSFSWWRRLTQWLGLGPKLVEEGPGDYERFFGYRATFAVERAFKGQVGKSLVVVTGRGRGDCGFPFKTGEQYLLFAYADGGGELFTSICTGTCPASLATSAIEAVEKLARER